MANFECRYGSGTAGGCKKDEFFVISQSMAALHQITLDMIEQIQNKPELSKDFKKQIVQPLIREAGRGERQILSSRKQAEDLLPCSKDCPYSTE